MRTTTRDQGGGALLASFLLGRAQLGEPAASGAAAWPRSMRGQPNPASPAEAAVASPVNTGSILPTCAQEKRLSTAPDRVVITPVIALNEFFLLKLSTSMHNDQESGT